MNKLRITISSFFGDRLNLFYALASVPLALITYFYIEWPFSMVVPIFGFIILILKKRKLSLLSEAGALSKTFGLLFIVGSFFVYYGLVLFFPSVAYYGSANYAVYLLGLFLVFFEFSALKEAFTPLFLIVASTSSAFVAALLKPFLSPFANDFAHVIVNILGALGINARAHIYSGIPVITFESLSGRVISSAFIYECIGVYSALVFSIILVVILFEDPSGWRAKLTYAIAGLLGTFALNILRVTIIFLADYFYGAEVGGTIHYVIGYALFSTWLGIFFYAHSKRQVLHAKITSLWKRIRPL